MWYRTDRNGSFDFCNITQLFELLSSYMPKITYHSIMKKYILLVYQHFQLFWKQRIRNVKQFQMPLFLKCLQKEFVSEPLETVTFLSSIQNYFLFCIPVFFTLWGDEHQIGCEIWFCFLKWKKYGCKRKVGKEEKHDVLTKVLRPINVTKSEYCSWGSGHQFFLKLFQAHVLYNNFVDFKKYKYLSLKTADPLSHKIPPLSQWFQQILSVTFSCSLSLNICIPSKYSLYNLWSLFTFSPPTYSSIIL